MKHIGSMTKFAAFNILIGMFSVLLLLVSVLMLTSYRPPKRLREKTGNVAAIEWQDEHWTDDLFGGASSAGFTLRLQDGSLYQATGILFDNIDRSIMSEVAYGAEITIIYNDEKGRPDKLYNIDKGGKTYQSIDACLRELEKERKIFESVGWCVIVGTPILAGVLGYVKYRKNKLL